MLAIPHLSPVNIFNEFAAPDPDPALVGNDNSDDSGIFQLDEDEKFYSLTIYADRKKFVMHGNGISLISNNSKYSPMFYTAQEVADLPIRVIGKVVELRAKF